MHTHVDLESADWDKVVSHSLNFDNSISLDNSIIQNMDIFVARSKVLLSDYPVRLFGSVAHFIDIFELKQ